MLRLRIDKANGETEHRFFTNAQKAHLIAIVEVRTGDAVRVIVENLAEKKSRKNLQKGLTADRVCATIQSERERR